MFFLPKAFLTHPNLLNMYETKGSSSNYGHIYSFCKSRSGLKSASCASTDIYYYKSKSKGEIKSLLESRTKCL